MTFIQLIIPNLLIVIRFLILIDVMNILISMKIYNCADQQMHSCITLVLIGLRRTAI